MKPGRRAATVVIPLGLIVLSSCGSPVETPTTDPATSPYSAAAEGECAPIDLRTPSGERVDLTGTWTGGQSVVFLRQLGNCVWWIALSDFPGQEIGSQFMLIFRGDLASDFTLSGEWMSVVRPEFLPGGRQGQVTFEIEIDAAAGGETLRLRSTSAEFGGAYSFVTLEYVGPLPVSAPI